MDKTFRSVITSSLLVSVLMSKTAPYVWG